MSNLDIRKILEDLMSGKMPIHRQGATSGQTNYYYINPNSDSYSSLKEEDIANVNSLKDPNPFLQQASNNNNFSNVNTQQSDFINSDTNAYQQAKKSFNNYFIPQEMYTGANWGQKTADKLNDYMQNYTSYPGEITTGVLAPVKDMFRNYNDMKNLDLIGADNFFHCKGNYEATQRGLWGESVGKAISSGRELFGLLSGDSLADIRKDWLANSMGWNGAKQGLTLEQSCPTNPKEYLDMEDYKNIF